jgi:hypothetical protein
MPSSPLTFQEPIAPEVLSSIAGRELLVEHLGHWPTFHDFEVLSLALERTLATAAACDLRVIFLVFDLSKAPDDPDRRQGTAEFLFEAIDALHIDGFNHQNPIMGLSIVRSGDHPFRVEWGGACMQHDVAFTCRRIAVLRVVDLNPFRRSSPSL